MKTTIAKTVVINMVETRNKAPASDLEQPQTEALLNPVILKMLAKLQYGQLFYYLFLYQDS